MDYTTLGRTGLRVSRMGLGCGGHSRLGLSLGRSEAEAEALVREAVGLGITFIDTAEGYGTEKVVGRGVAASGVARGDLVISTKAGVEWKERLCTGAEMRERVEACLKRLGTDYVDVFNIHGVTARQYPYAVSELLPAIIEMQAAGKVRFVGITETFGPDPQHKMLATAVTDNWWDVVMVGFNVLNQSARERVLTYTRRQGIGTLCMFAVRRALSRPEALRELMTELAKKGLISTDSFDADDPLGFLLTEGGASSVPEAAYRFCRYEPGLDVILSGTSSVKHLRQNAASVELPPLPPAVVTRLRELFEQVDCVSGN